MSDQTSAYHYEVLSTPGADQAELAHLLNHIVSKGGRAISVVWSTGRTSNGRPQDEGYVIVAEYPGLREE